MTYSNHRTIHHEVKMFIVVNGSQVFSRESRLLLSNYFIHKEFYQSKFTPSRGRLMRLSNPAKRRWGKNVCAQHFLLNMGFQTTSWRTQTWQNASWVRLLHVKTIQDWIFTIFGLIDRCYIVFDSSSKISSEPKPAFKMSVKGPNGSE